MRTLNRKEMREPRCRDKESDYGVTESARGGGVQEQVKECWDVNT